MNQWSYQSVNWVNCLNPGLTYGQAIISICTEHLELPRMEKIKILPSLWNDKVLHLLRNEMVDRSRDQQKHVFDAEQNLKILCH